MSNGQNSVVILFLLGALCFQHAAAKPVAGCLDETGAPVDWWAALKYPHSTTYSYADANNKVFSKSSPGGLLERSWRHLGSEMPSRANKSPTCQQKLCF